MPALRRAPAHRRPHVHRISHDVDEVTYEQLVAVANLVGEAGKLQPVGEAEQGDVGVPVSQEAVEAVGGPVYEDEGLLLRPPDGTPGAPMSRWTP